MISIDHFRVALNLIMKARLSVKLFVIMKISFLPYENKTNFHVKRFALSLAFIVRFKATVRLRPVTLIASCTNANQRIF